MFATSLKFLDLSYNLITTVKGLESMKDLIVLRLDSNQIYSSTSVRALAFNR